MKFKTGDIVQVINENAFYNGALGEVAEVDDDEILVHFIAVNDITGEVFVYEECFYQEEELDLFVKNNE